VFDRKNDSIKRTTDTKRDGREDDEEKLLVAQLHIYTGGGTLPSRECPTVPSCFWALGCREHGTSYARRRLRFGNGLLSESSDCWNRCLIFAPLRDSKGYTLAA